jgi:hypothetical protein
MIIDVVSIAREKIERNTKEGSDERKTCMDILSGYKDKLQRLGDDHLGDYLECCKKIHDFEEKIKDNGKISFDMRDVKESIKNKISSALN